MFRCNHIRVAQAGKSGAVTIATNMAGRGTDIMLGGNAETMALDELKKGDYTPELLYEANGHAETDDPEVLAIRAKFDELYKKFKQETDADASQHNVILLYYNDPNYGKVEVTLPTETSVASSFGVVSLPDNFAAIVTFRVRPGSKNIVLKGIYDHNENMINYELASGDSIQVLISKIDGFRYQILNHSN